MVAANFRTGDPPPPGRDEMLIDIDSPFIENIAVTLVKAWLYHVDFVTPSNSTIGIGATILPTLLSQSARLSKPGQMRLGLASCPSREPANTSIPWATES